ncbi:MAG: hypothetical protein PHE55_23295 [Methylococcaceae bacterium]|nr:hypothetical protein [Methylococcaceae bacterium]
MTQKPKSKGPLVTGGIVTGVVVLGLAGFFAWKAVAPSAAQLPVTTYLANARGLAGNRYAFQARIERQIDNRPGVGRIILARETSTGSPVPFLDGGKALSFNPEPGQLYKLTVQVALDGLLELTDARKL